MPAIPQQQSGVVSIGNAPNAGLIEEGHPPSEALRRAQDALRRERRWADPNAWAGFVFQGDWR